MNLDIDEVKLPEAADLALEDKWILDKLNDLAANVCQNLDHYEVGVSLANIYDFVWDMFCDWYIELCKPRLSAGDKTAQNVIAYVLRETLKLLHPFMPFITEEIYQKLPRDAESIMISVFPRENPALHFDAEAAEMEKIIALIKAIRARRTEMGVAPPAAQSCISSPRAQRPLRTPRPSSKSSRVRPRLNSQTATPIPQRCRSSPTAPQRISRLPI